MNQLRGHIHEQTNEPQGPNVPWNPCSRGLILTVWILQMKHPVPGITGSSELRGLHSSHEAELVPAYLVSLPLHIPYSLLFDQLLEGEKRTS